MSAENIRVRCVAGSTSPRTEDGPQSTFGPIPDAPGEVMYPALDGGPADPPPGEPPPPYCQRCDKRVDQRTIGPMVGLGHCPACGIYTCRGCWAEALGACPACGIAFGDTVPAPATVSPRAHRDQADRRSRRRPTIAVVRRLGAAVSLLAALVLIASPFVTNAVRDSRDPMWVGVEVESGNAATEIKGAVDYVRLDTPSNSLVATYNSAGLHVLDVIAGPYGTDGVRAIDADAWAKDAVATYRASPNILAIEILNEPGGSWFWGADALSQSNAIAYAGLLKTVHDAFVSAFGANRPLLIASYDGGYSGSNVWGRQVWAADPHVSSYIDGISMHPYGGIEDVASAALGNRAAVAAAHLATGLPVFVTEVGWPTAVGQLATNDSLQWSEADQATNIYDFIQWARDTGYVKAVIVFEYRDADANMAYGITRLDGTHKESFEDLRRAASGLPGSP